MNKNKIDLTKSRDRGGRLIMDSKEALTYNLIILIGGYGFNRLLSYYSYFY